MAVSQRTISRNLPNVPQAAGGAVGIGAPVALRETVDVRNGQATTLLGTPDSILGRLTTPSVAWGLGVGGLTGALWWLDVGGRSLKDFYLAHTVTGVPTGIVSALLPKGAATGAQAQTSVQQRLGEMSQSLAGDGEFAPAGGSSGAAQ